jgi:hypothetical protein
MPTYNLYCEDCDQDIEIFCKISEYEIRMKNIVCPNCISKNVYRNYQEDNIYSSVNDIRTIGQLAEFNTKKMGSQLAEEYEKNKKPETKQWYQHNKYGDATRKQINSMTPEQKKKYIIEGKK